MPVDIKTEMDKVREDGRITPDESEKVMHIFDMALERIEKINKEKEEQRVEFEKKHDAQIVQMALVIAGSISTSMLGILAGLGFSLPEIATFMLTLCGSLITGIGMAFVKRYIPAIVEPIKKAVDLVKDQIPQPIKDTLDEALKEQAIPEVQPNDGNPTD